MRLPISLCCLFLACSFARASVDETLDALHDAGKDLQSLSADVTLTDVDTGGLGNDAIIHTGTIVMDRQNGTRALISIKKKQVGTRIEEDARDVLLDGPNLIDRDYKNKKQTTRQIRRPEEKVDLFKLGEGPFPLPVGQAKEDVKKQFDVTEVKPWTLKLIPKAGTDLARKFQKIIVTLDPATKFPTTIQTTDPNAATDTTVTLTHLKLNSSVANDAFKLPAVDPKVWNLVDAAG